jgi:hypothetical protein
MQALQKHLKEKAEEFSRHPFFARLERPAPLAEVICFPALLTFWVMGFQDALRLNTSLVTDPVLRPIAQRHRREDRGHDAWFLQDLQLIDGELPDLRWLFSEEHWVTREMTYGMLAETFRAQEDIERIVVVIAFEEAGHVFFSRIVRYFEHAGVAGALRYFASSHFEIEQSHDLHGDQTTQAINAIELSPASYDRCRDAVDRCFARFVTLFDDIEAKLEARHFEAELHPCGVQRLWNAVGTSTAWKAASLTDLNRAPSAGPLRRRPGPYSQPGPPSRVPAGSPGGPPAYMSRTTSVTGRAQQMSTSASAGGSSGSGE